MMLKIVLFTLLVAAVSAGPTKGPKNEDGSGGQSGGDRGSRGGQSGGDRGSSGGQSGGDRGSSEEDEAPFNVADFKNELDTFKEGSAKAMDHASALMNIAANAGSMDEIDMDEVHHNFHNIDELFDNEEKRLLHILLRFWQSTGDFLIKSNCNSTVLFANMADDSMTDDDFNNGRLASYHKDFTCFVTAFQGAEQIDTSNMVSGYKESDALSMIFSIGLEMYVIRHDGERFTEAHEALEQEAASRDIKDKRFAKMVDMLKRIMNSKN